MSAYSEIYEQFPGAMFNLALQECWNNFRPVYWLGDFKGSASWKFDHRCDFCDGQAAFIWGGLNGRYAYGANPNSRGMRSTNIRERICNNEECVKLGKWFFSSNKGAGRRQNFRSFFGMRFEDVDVRIRRDALLAAMLKQQVSERNQYERAKDVA